MREIKEYVEKLERAKSYNMTLKEYCRVTGESIKEYKDAIAQVMNSNLENKEDIKSLYDSLNDDSRYNVTPIRENGKIVSYEVTVKVRDSKSFHATLSREEAETLFGLYTYYGGNVTTRNVANEFPKYTLPEVKYLFRAFGITKDSMWAPQHLIEELTLEELSQYRMNLKERAAFKYADARQERDFNNQIKKMASEINRLNDKNAIIESLLGPINYDKVSVKSSKKNHNLTGIICLADLHIGAFNVPEGYIDLPEYSETEINRRLDIIINYIKNKKWDNVILLNLGDNVDSYKKMTSSMTHQLPCVNTDREIAQMYLRVMMRFVNQVKQLIN